MTPVVLSFADRRAWLDAAMARLHDALSGTAGQRIVCLSGGRTPQPFYALVAERIRQGALPAERVHWVIGDERAVAYDHPRSNYGMIQRILFEPAGIPDRLVHRMPAAEPDLASAARAFETELQDLYGARALDPTRPLFGLNLLGLGDDGHVASLFPGADALQERRRWVLPTRAPDGEARLSLTFPVLESARHMLVLVEGSEKRDPLARWCRGDAGIPAARLAPPGGVIVVADRDAAGR